MKRYIVMMLVLVVGLALTSVVSAGDKDAIKAQVDEIVMAIDGGKMASDFTEAANRKPYYVYIMEMNGILLVHPSLVGQNLKEKAAPAYDAVVQATPDGTWVQYEWKGKEKNAYVRQTKSGVIVGSGY
jgi:signal transduction histidine kinase